MAPAGDGDKTGKGEAYRTRRVYVAPANFMNDPFPASEFDDWAETYDQSIVPDRFPFDGYARVLNTVVTLADARSGLSVLDLGTGTGNLAARFAALGCELWCTDFSPAMLEKARAKLPRAHCVLHDLRGDWPAELERRFDRIVSAYVFHHFELEDKVHLVRQLVCERLGPGGRLVLADIAFPEPTTLQAVRLAAGEEWEEEFYWIASEALPAMERAGITANYQQVSSCAGVFTFAAMD
jgi:putative AdoMet-dependent methyltransferase